MELLGKSKQELTDLAVSLGEPAYRGAQLYQSLYVERIFDLAKMSTLPAAFRERLANESRITLPVIRQRYNSTDGSVRYLFALPSGEDRATSRAASVEAVFMPSEGRQTICISTQAGCAVDCQFCLTAQLGLIRNLTAAEVAGQVLVLLEEHRETLAPRTNVVLMGQGEPLLNYDRVLAAVRLMLDPAGMGLAARHETLSTTRIVPRIMRLAQERVRPRLAVSLNASTDAQRDAIMPVNRKYPLRD